MDENKKTYMADKHHLFYSPLGEEKVERLIKLIGASGLRSGMKVLDAGCGRAELLIRLVERYGVSGLGVDSWPYAIEVAQSELAKRVPGSDLQLLTANMDEVYVESNTLDLAICIGATHLFGNYQGTFTALCPLLRPGGLALVGDTYWRHEPSDAFLARLGVTHEEYTDYPGMASVAEAAGYTPLYMVDSNQDEWDHFEWLFTWGAQLHLTENPGDPGIARIEEQSRATLQRYMLGGRDSLGFAVGLFRRPV